MKNLVAKLVVVGTLSALVLGCGSTKSADNSPAAPGDSAGAKTKVVFIPKNAGNPYFARVEEGLKKATGIDLSTQAPQSGDATSQISVLKDQVQRGQQVIILSPNSPDALNETLDQITAKGVTVVTADSDLTGNESHRTIGVWPVDFATIGPEQIELLGSMVNYEGEFAILSATTDAPNQNAWIAGMKETLKLPKYAKMKLVEIVYGDDKPEKSAIETEALLSKHPGLRGIIAPTSAGLASAAQVLSQKEVYPGGKNAKGPGLVLTGLGMPNELRKAVTNGVVQKFQLWDPADIGEVAAYVGAQIQAKKLEAKVGAKFSVPGKGDYEIKEKNIVIAGKLVTFEKSNIEQYQY